jgi:hypothetical protein
VICARPPRLNGAPVNAVHVQQRALVLAAGASVGLSAWVDAVASVPPHRGDDGGVGRDYWQAWLVNGLQPACRYQFRLRVANRAGFSVFSEPSVAVTTLSTNHQS